MGKGVYRKFKGLAKRYNDKIIFYKKELFKFIIPFQSSLFVILQTLFGRAVWRSMTFDHTLKPTRRKG